jgi:hypothetical protein
MPMPAPASLGSHPNSNIIGAMTELAGCAAADTRSRTDADADASGGLAAGTLYHRPRLKHGGTKAITPCAARRLRSGAEDVFFV